MSPRKFLFALLFTSFLLGRMTSAHAVMIVDTGAPAAPPTGFAWALDNNYWFASQFTTNVDYSITSLEGWLWEGESGLDRLTDGIAEAVLYGNAGILPNTANEIFRQTFTIPNNDPDGFPVDTPGQNPYGWHGATGLNVPLTAGTYWLAFEIRANLYPNDYYDGAIGAPAPNPLSVEAYAQGFDGIYKSLDSDIGVRIQGELLGQQQPPSTTAVPEPASVFLLGAGLLGFAARRKSSK